MGRRVLIAGGGTGGHLFPGLAVAEELRSRGAEVRFVGTRRGIEARVLPATEFPLSFIEIEGLKGRGLRALLSALRWPKVAVQTARLLRAARPDVVVGVGGYASGPVVLLARLLGIPTAILEQNSVPGITNRVLGKIVRRVFTTYPESDVFFPNEKTARLGNPIRKRLLQPGAAGARVGCVLVLGGSQGAHAVNELVAGALEHLAREGQALPPVLHQTGAADAEAIRGRYLALGQPEGRLRVQPFIEDMAQAYAQADLVIGRAGATTLSELTALGVPAILIPFPFAADDHQTHNARFLEAQGAARVLPQAGATPAALAALLLGILQDPQGRAKMAAESRKLGRPDAASTVADAVLHLAGAR